MKILLLLLCLLTEIRALSQDDNVVDFNAVDINKNGEISMDEFLKWYTREHKATNIVKNQRLFASYDTNVDGVLSVSEFVPLAYTLSRSSNSIGENLFKKLDVNGDGFLTKSEAEHSDEHVAKEITAGIFELGDINNDGKVALKEFLAVVDTGREDADELSQNRGVAQTLIASIDKNNDEKLDRKEIRTFANQYNRVSEQEIGTVFEILDENRDEVIELKELQKLPLKVIALAGIRAMPSV